MLSCPDITRAAYPGASTAALRLLSHAAERLLVLLIGAYRIAVSPLLGPSCRFEPTCSTYAMQAIQRYGPLGGIARALARIARCHPLARGGYDPLT